MGLRGFQGQARKLAQDELWEQTRGEKQIMPWQRRGMPRVEKVIRFLEFLPITKGKLTGSKMRLLPSQRAFIEDVYGRPDTARVRLGILSEPRGNGKTGLIAGLALCHLLGPEAEQRGECYSAGIDRLQAALIFNEMEAMILAVPSFAARCNVKRFTKTIEVLDGVGEGSHYEALSADARRAHGLAPSWFAYDELAQAKDRVLFDNLQTAMGKRRRSLGIIISTQAANDDHPMSLLIDDAKRGGDPSIVLHLLSAPADADPFDADVIRSVNPAFGKFLDEADVLSEAERARRMPSFEPAFRNLRLNQRIAPFARDQMMTPEEWALGNGAVDEALFCDGRPVFGGLDLSSTTDLTALVLATEDDAGNVHLLPRIWTPADTLVERSLKDRAHYDVWARADQLMAVPGKAIDYDWVATALAGDLARMNIRQINYDRWGVQQFTQVLDRLGISAPLQPMAQDIRNMSPAVKAFQTLAVTGRIRHGNHPLLRWCFANAVLTRDPNDNRKLDKARSFGRIDVAVAAVMAVAAMTMTTATPDYDVAALIG